MTAANRNDRITAVTKHHKGTMLSAKKRKGKPKDDDDFVYPQQTLFPQTIEVKSARRKVTRWQNDTDPPTRGTWMAKYLLFKMEKDKFHLKLKKHHFARVNQVLDKVDREFIKSELLTHHEKSASGKIGVSKQQVENFRILHHEIGDMTNVGTPYLHNWLNTLVKGVFPKKHLYEAFYFRNPKQIKEEEWKDCDFHLDISDGPEEWDFQSITDKAPITIYFPVGDTPITLEVEYLFRTTGRPRIKKTVELKMKPGDVLFFNTTTCRHRTGKPDPKVEVPDRVNIILSGFKELVELAPDG